MNCLQAIDAYQVEDYKLSGAILFASVFPTSAQSPACICWASLGPLAAPAGSACVGPALLSHSAPPLSQLSTRVHLAWFTHPCLPCLVHPPLFTLLGSPTLVHLAWFTHPCVHPALHPSASMNVLNVAQSVVIYTGMAAGLLVCTKVRGTGCMPLMQCPAERGVCSGYCGCL